MHGAAQSTTDGAPSRPDRERRGGPLDPRLLRTARTHPAFRRAGRGHRRCDSPAAHRPGLADRDRRRRRLPRAPHRRIAADAAGRTGPGNRRPGRAGVGRRARRAQSRCVGQVGAAAGRRRAHRRPRALAASTGATPGELGVLLTTGIDALDGYFSRYLPQLFLAVIVPVAVIAVVAGADWVSAVLIAVSLPLIPIFMALVGATTRDRTAARLRSLQRLAGHFLDVVGWAPDPQGLRPGQGPGPRHRGRHRPLPLGHHGDAPADLPLLARPRAPRHGLGCPRRRCRRPPPPGRDA